ncbi:MAG TPA: S53 family peptidase [Alphaproteobacteria bacterium]|nr:S53 family peptidase [Alphaproteobacteria bacterium]
MLKPIVAATAAVIAGLTAASPAAYAQSGSDSAAPSAHRMNVAAWVSSAQKVGDAADTGTVHVALFLAFKNQKALEKLIEAQYTPGNAAYGEYLTPEQFRARFAPDAEKVARVQDTLKKLGFIIEYTPKSGLFVQAAGSVAQVKSAFGVSQGLYSFNGKTLRANAETPRLPARIADIVTYVGGLDESNALLKPGRISLRGDKSDIAPLRQSDAATSSPNALPPTPGTPESPFCSTYWGDRTATLSTAPKPFAKTLPWLICGYTPQQIRQAYRADKVTQTGKGVRVGIVDTYASPTIVQETNLYSKNHGLPPLTSANFKQRVPPGLYTVPKSDPCDPQSWYGEETLDVQAVHAMAPQADIVYAGNTCSDPGNTALYNLIDDHAADIITNSYGFGGEALSAGDIRAETQYFMQAAAEGISIVFSTGDDGDLMASNNIASGSWESTSPYVTAVGGTSLALLNSTGKKSEWGWGTYRALLTGAKLAADGKSIADTGTKAFDFYSGAGGGPSLSLLAPDYQSNVPAAFSRHTTRANGQTQTFPSAHRVTPDIAMLGDPYTGFLIGEIYTIAGDAALDSGCKKLSATTEYCEGGTGGTSLSSPLFAGVLALADQARFAKKLPALGLVNTALYSLKVGAPGTDTAPIIDTHMPSGPTALLRGYIGEPTKIRVVTINASVNGAKTAVTEGADTSYLTQPGYDMVTGLGTPNVPAFIKALAR